MKVIETSFLKPKFHLFSLGKHFLMIKEKSVSTLNINDVTKEGIVIKRGNRIQMSVDKGWNLIGSVKTGKMKSINIDNNLIYEFDDGYKVVDEVIEGKGYWVKCMNNGIIEYE